MREYTVEVEREGRWWMISVPEIDGLTQARRIGEVEEMARSLIAVSTGTPVAEVSVRVTRIGVPGLADIASAAERVRQLRSEAAGAESRALRESGNFAAMLTSAGIPVRDTASLIGVSPQRVSQLAAP